MKPLRMTPLEPWIRSHTGLAPDGGFTRQGLRQYQLQRIRQSLAYAARRSPFYRRQLDGCGDFSGIEFNGFASLPFTTPEDLCRDPLEFLCVSHQEVARVVTIRTSGTTGLPKRLFFTETDLEPTVDFFRHGMSTLVQAGQRVLILMPGELPGSVGDLLVKGLDRLGAQGIVHGPVRDPANTIAEILARRPDSLVGIPVQVLGLVRHPQSARIPAGLIRSVLLSTDYVPTSVVEDIQQSWGCDVYRHYGMTEMGYGGGVECDAHEGYHLREADLFVEIVDPLSGRRLPDGAAGEVVFTTLDRRAMPLIRYRTGDIARFLPAMCPCGSVLPRLGKIQGRKANEAVLAPQMRLPMSMLDEALFAIPEILDFQAEITAADGRSRLEVMLHCNADRLPEIARRVRQRLAGVPAVRWAIDQGLLDIGPIRLSSEKWFTTGAAKRTFIDRRQDK
jgi:phenylacetate-coenzyme A ligase PaaK-like adenylate-forming protein